MKIYAAHSKATGKNKLIDSSVEHGPSLLTADEVSSTRKCS